MKKIKKTSPIMVVAGFLCIATLTFIFTNYNLGFNSDASAANILAREQIRMKSWFPSTWNTSTGLFVFSYNNLIVLLSGLFNNQILMRNIAVAVVLAVFLTILRYFFKNILESDAYLIFLCLFFSGCSDMVIELAFAQAAYLFSLLDNLLLIILFVKLFRKKSKCKCFIVYLIYTGFIIYLSLYGTLNLAYQIFPLIGAVLLSFIIENWQEKSINRDNVKKVLPAVAITLVGAMIGLYGYRYLAKISDFTSGVDITYPDTSDLIDNLAKFILCAIGFKTGGTLFSVQGIMNVVIIVIFGIALVCVVNLIKRYHEQSPIVKLFINYAICIWFIYVYFDLFVYSVDADNNRYFFKPLMFIYMIAAYYIQKYIWHKGAVAKACVIGGICLFSLPYTLSGLGQLPQYPQRFAEEKALVSCLKENNLTHGYATFWNAGKNMVLSNFDIEIGGVILSDSIEPYYWLSSDLTYDPNEYAGESFLLLDESENETFCESEGFIQLGEPSRQIECGGFHIYVFPYNIAENNFRGVGLKNREIIQNMSVSDDEMRQTDGSIIVKKNQIVYGPYIHLLAGTYQIAYDFAELSDKVTVRLTANCGQKVLQELIIDKTIGTITFQTNEEVEDFEVVFETNTSARLQALIISMDEQKSEVKK